MHMCVRGIDVTTDYTIYLLDVKRGSKSVVYDCFSFHQQCILRLYMTFYMLNFMLFIFRQIAEKVECVD
jgi:hypothetical protein